MGVSYLVDPDQSPPTIVYRVTEDRAYYSSVVRPKWVEDFEIRLRITGLGGDGHVTQITRDRALELVRSWGGSPDSIDG